MSKQKHVEERGDHFVLALGVISDKLGAQMKRQHLQYDAEDMRYFEKLRDAMNHLTVASLLTERESDRVKIKLYNAIARHIETKNKGVKIQKLKYGKI